MFFSYPPDKRPFGYFMKSIFKSWLLTVSKFQNQIFLFSLEPKIDFSFFLILKLAISKVQKFEYIMFFFYVLSFFKNGDTIQGGKLFKKGHYLRKYGMFYFWPKI